MMQQWILSQLTQLMELPHSSDHFPITGICVDTRTLLPGQLFFALPGAKTDGQNFIAEAAAKKASAAVVSKKYKGPDFGMTLLAVDDPLKALQKAAKNALKGRKSKIIAVTGSIGKTTTKEFISTLLRERYHIGYSPGNSNSQIGLPLTILNHTHGNEEILVLEMGMTQKGQITELVNIAPPDVAVLTTVALVHAGNFDSIEDIARAKAEIFSHPKTWLGILPSELPNYREIITQKGCPKISFSKISKRADYQWCEGNTIRTSYQRIDLPVLPIPGDHNRHNLLAAIAAVRALGLTWEEICTGIPKLKLPERRLEQVKKQGILFINDSYNASEVSLKASLQSLPPAKKGKKRIAIIGNIPELGKFSDSAHRAVGEAALKYVDNLICLGKSCQPMVDCWRNAKKPVKWCENLDEVVSVLKQIMAKGDVVLLKGANILQLWKVLDKINN